MTNVAEGPKRSVRDLVRDEGTTVRRAGATEITGGSCGMWDASCGSVGMSVTELDELVEPHGCSGNS